MEAMEDYKIIHEKVSSRWEVCVTVSNNGFQQASFVNSIATTKVSNAAVRIVVYEVLTRFIYLKASYCRLDVVCRKMVF